MDSSVHAVVVSQYIRERIEEAAAVRAARWARRRDGAESGRDTVRVTEPRPWWSPGGARRSRSAQSAG